MFDLRPRIARGLKGFLCRRLRIPYNPHGVPIPLAARLREGVPIVLVDVGASRGDFTRLLAGYCGIARGILIEPLPEAASRLRLLYPPPRFTVVEGVLDSAPGVRDFHVNDFKETSSLLQIRRGLPELSGVELGGHAVIQCRATTLDEVVREEGIDGIDLLKLDVQGKEDDVLAGARESLPKTSLIWTEVSFKRLYDGSCTFFDVHARLAAAGFALTAIEPGLRAPDGELLQADALFVRKGGEPAAPRGEGDRQCPR